MHTGPAATYNCNILEGAGAYGGAADQSKPFQKEPAMMVNISHTYECI